MQLLTAHLHSSLVRGYCKQRMNKQRVIFLLLPDVHLLDLAGPVQTFYLANQLGADYELLFCAHQDTINSAQGLLFAQLEPPTSITANDLVIVPGTNIDSTALDTSLLTAATRDWLREAYRADARIASVCSGAFALGEAGLLDQRRCTTHWYLVPVLQARYPTAQVVDAALFVHDRGVTTSAGIASGIDMALSLVEQKQGPLFTAQVARHLVIYLRRNGTQPQHSVYLEYRTHLHPGVHCAQDYLIVHLTEPVSLSDLATVARMSPRNLSRAFKEATGLTPVQYQQRLRLELAANLLGNRELTIYEIALKCGFEDARHFRRLWQRYFGTSPSVARNTSVRSA